jgi:hypothetical protein
LKFDGNGVSSLLADSNATLLDSNTQPNATVLGYDSNVAGDALAVALFSLAFTFVGAGLFSIARMRKERVPQEAFIGIVYAAASAAAVLILSKSPTVERN